MAGRPQKNTEIIEAETIETKDDNALNTPNVNDIKNENLELKSQISEMMKMIESLKNNSINTDIDMSKRVTITSITTGGINLKTNNDGTAKRFRLERLGQTIPIIYEDLINCINMDRWIFEEGLVYINNEKAISENYLEEYYNKFLTLDKITNIMDFDKETIQEMVSNTTPSIQETICVILAQKINNGDYIDMNKIEIIGKSCTPQIDIRDLSAKLR